MSDGFLGRTHELEYLEAEYLRPSSNMIPIYGRRRVGKTSLIWEFLKGKPHVYVVGSHAPAEQHLKEFLDALASACDEPLFRDLSINSWKDALELAAPHVGLMKRSWSSRWMNSNGLSVPRKLCQVSCNNGGIKTGRNAESDLS